MRRKLMILAVLAVLALPLVARAGDHVVAGADNHPDPGRTWDDTGWMPSWWTTTPPASKTVDLVQLAEVLLAKGVITPQEYAQLTQSQSAMSSSQSRATARQSGYNSALTTP